MVMAMAVAVAVAVAYVAPVEAQERDSLRRIMYA